MITTREAFVMEVQARVDGRLLRDRVLKQYRVDIFGKNRMAVTVHYRRLVMWVLRQRGYSMPAIAAAVGLVNHTSVLYALRQVEERGLQGEAVALDDRHKMRQAA